ncbi:MAG: hypothetical protein PWQ67_27 [Clostridia bacterium]|nr:hypothetical protein [Clostridia bacterium]MDN5321573.1 hypothetical protein [Clostridia bacterium]
MKRQLPPCPSGVYWEIARGDTLYKIAKATNVSLKELINANPHVSPEKLKIGDKICIPEGGKNLSNLKKLPKCPGGVYWEIAPGDTIYKIAKETNLTVAKILKANPGINPNNLKAGQNICLPQ